MEAADAAAAFEHLAANVTAAVEQLKEVLGDKWNELLQIPFDQAPAALLDYIKDNPGQTFFYVANGAIFFSPALVTGPLLSLLGFTALGPRLATIATAVHSKFGTIWLFRIFQSAAMGGYGGPVLAGMARGAALAETAVGGAVQWLAQNNRTVPEL